MKKIFLTTLLMIVFLLNGCASDSTETQIESYDTQETLQVNKKEFSNRAGSDCTIKEFKLFSNWRNNRIISYYWKNNKCKLYIYLLWNIIYIL